ncbi:hypothetical protein J2741_000355 [Methanolinea mesophila]|uniref:PsbP-related protein n=1 Tax=Methanolinea mesophila TaxID=547055 RepID=UPI001AEA2275|nr:PsbP-related protein [Methanolinea mesophila]MBP1927808.1 hypothetical protein [Methanolinea mesophila]
MREQILLILLMFSLIGNVYLLFFDHSDLDANMDDVLNGSFPENLTLFGKELNFSFPFPSNISILGKSFNLSIPVPDNLTLMGTEFNGSSRTPATRATEVVTTTVTTATPTPTRTRTPTPTQTPKPTPTPDPNAWKDYSNANYRFSLQYPPTWTLNENNGPYPVIEIEAPPQDFCDNRSGECYRLITKVTVDVDTNPFTTVLEDYFNEAVATLQRDYSITAVSKSAPTSLSEVKAYRIEYYTRDERGNKLNSVLQYYSVIDGKVYILSYMGPYSQYDDSIYQVNKPDARNIFLSFIVDREFREIS